MLPISFSYLVWLLTPQTVISSVVPDSGDHSQATEPFWRDYTYCEGRVIRPGNSWHPLRDAEMVKLQVMHRHGARTPSFGKIPTDDTEWYECGHPDEFMFMNEGYALEPSRSPYMKEQSVVDGAFAFNLWKGNCDVGQLTTKGSARMNVVGRVLREVYVDRLGFLPKYMDSAFQISHTYIWRTRESVENLMAGMYPIQYRRPDQTLTMHVKPSVIETMLSNTGACARLAGLNTLYQSSTALNYTIGPYKELNQKLVDAYNTSNDPEWNNPGALFDTASSAYCHGLGLKGSLTPADVQTGTIPATSSLHNFYRNNPDGEEAKRLSAGPWLAEILASFADRSTKLQVYSAHDASLDMFLSVVADPDMPWPAYSASVEIELWRHRRKGMLVRMYYEGMVLPAHPHLKCSFEGCPLGTLKVFLQSYIPTDMQKACHVAK